MLKRKCNNSIICHALSQTYLVNQIQVFIEYVYLVDSVLTIIGAFIIAKTYKIDFWFSLLNFFILGEVLHYLFGVNTAFINIIGLKRNCE